MRALAHATAPAGLAPAPARLAKERAYPIPTPEHPSCLVGRAADGGLYGLHLLGWLHLGYRGDQFLFVRMTSLPRQSTQVVPLQRELASFLAMPPPPDVPKKGVCITPTMVTTKRQRLRAHNASVAQVKAAFRQSATATSLQTFLDGHEALLQALIAREHVKVI